MFQYREHGTLHVLLVHPGGPFWKNRDDGAWSIPKGEYAADENPLSAARREFREELGVEPIGECQPLGEIRQKGGKIVTGFALQGDFDPATLRSSEFELQWPPKSGKLQRFPEVDRAQWFAIPQARIKILERQQDFLDRLLQLTERAER